MTVSFFSGLNPVKKYFLLLCLLLFISQGYSQKEKADSLRRLLNFEKVDSTRASLMWQLASAINVYNPDTALFLSQQSLYLSKNINYLEGESRALGVLANTFLKFGNYPRALELYIQKLKLEEKRNKPRNLSSVLQNIGIVYVLQEDYRKALEYILKADSVVNLHDVQDMKYYIALNLGDTYRRIDIIDSAYHYFNRSLELAMKEKDDDQIGTSMTGLGHAYLKLGNYPLSLTNYQTAISYLKAANDDEVLCEATLGLANLYKQLGKPDSVSHYANLSLSIAKKVGFLTEELKAAEFLSQHYRDIKRIDSAFSYVTQVHDLNDSLNSKTKVRELQLISSDEQFRQLELAETKRQEQKKRFQQMQMLLIAIFIPGFFLLTLLLNRIRIHIKVIRLLGVLSLLFLFEYLTLLLHPTVAELTHHTPVYEILIFVGIAAILIPAHHRLEHWMIHKLSHHHHKLHHAEKVKEPVAATTGTKENPPAIIKKK
jgi:tetratricopeptide (TPR) repeat protein